ncbi:hypothetical protein [Clostridium cellulovorans]|uniref:Uncharacterized protein n=1 Tax=Clostridium cellulovorans (strain ATCC 35296 / DSM 3052 / OCM 3 / 743B) TaxID=573061 RepID=D9SQH8_CLOC7|nr:hypothetical protein [Clostridium cellulovorans]ADL50245.1 hypothetical protein Clocel_0469 [Clostridium cellulovorans 743B]
MKKRKLVKGNIILSMGLLTLSATLILEQTLNLPHFVSGVGLGIAIGLEIFGLYLMGKNKKQATGEK